VCTITVSGKPEPENDNWKAHAAYMYTQKEGTSYVYTFEAWTKSGARKLYLNYFENNDTGTYLNESFQITSTRQTYTVYGETLPKLGQNPALRFYCADQLGTFYVKILETKEYTIGKLTITNFSVSLNKNITNNISGSALLFVNGAPLDTTRLEFCYSIRSMKGWIFTVRVKGNTITIPVWEANYDEETVVPYTGSTTVSAGSLFLVKDNLSATSDILINSDFYTNKVSITFTNGSANINFETQMEFSLYGPPPPLMKEPKESKEPPPLVSQPIEGEP